MKKLILSALLLGSISIFAQGEQAKVETKAATTNTAKPTQEVFKELKAEELPEAVKTALKTSYPDATLTKAFVNEKKEYKMEIAVGDKTATVYADAEGNWLKK